jgi:hypothetical protein
MVMPRCLRILYRLTILLIFAFYVEASKRAGLLVMHEHREEARTFARVPNSQIKWYQNWHIQPSAGIPSNLKFYPMIKGDGSLSTAAIKEMKRHNSPRPFLMFNELDMAHGDGGIDISPQRAAAVWIETANKLAASGYEPIFGGTAGNEAGQEWFRQFKKACNGQCKCHYLFCFAHIRTFATATP